MELSSILETSAGAAVSGLVRNLVLKAALASDGGMSPDRAFAWVSVGSAVVGGVMAMYGRPWAQKMGVGMLAGVAFDQVYRGF